MDLILVLIVIGATAFNVWRMGQTPPPAQVQPMPKTAEPKSNNQTNNTDFVYPGATLIGDNTYQSFDDPAKVTDWYKNKINGAGMNVTSFVVTNTNDNVLNKLVGANSSTRVSVDIMKNNGENQTTIKLSA